MTIAEISQLLKERNAPDQYFLIAVQSTVLGRMMHYGLTDDEVLSLISGLLNTLHAAIKDATVRSSFDEFTVAVTSFNADD